MSFVLIIVAMTMTPRPVVVTAEFSSMETCVAALNAVAGDFRQAGGASMGVVVSARCYRK